MPPVKPLSEGEKVKNWLLMGLSEEVQTELHDEHWLVIERALAHVMMRRRSTCSCAT